MNRPALQIAFLTGQADPHSCALSAAQREFLRRLATAAADVAMVSHNFPYTERTPPARLRPLWMESLSVARQFFAARRPAFAERHRPAVLAMLAGADETVLLAGSCGLELLQCLRLPDDELARISIVAYGTVAKSRPSCPGVLVLGRRDWIARGRGPAPDRVVECDHLTYLANEEFAALSADFVRQRTARALSIETRTRSATADLRHHAPAL